MSYPSRCGGGVGGVHAPALRWPVGGLGGGRPDQGEQVLQVRDVLRERDGAVSGRIDSAEGGDGIGVGVGPYEN